MVKTNILILQPKAHSAVVVVVGCKFLELIYNGCILSAGSVQLKLSYPYQTPVNLSQ